MYGIDVRGAKAQAVCERITGARSVCRSVVVWLAVLTVLSSTRLSAVPYASNLTNAQGIVSFRLNAGADRVWIVYDGGLSTNQLGRLQAGLHQVELPSTGPFQVVVFKVSPLSYATFRGSNQIDALQISSDTNQNARFFSPRGIAVNTDPTSPWFGRVYVANSEAGTVTNNAFGPERTTLDGMYALNSDLSDAVGQGDRALTCDLYMTNTDRAPFRLSMGAKGEVYVCDASESDANLYEVDGDLVLGSVVLPGEDGGGFPVGLDRLHGQILAAVVTGVLTEGDGLTAYLVDADRQYDPVSPIRSTLNSIWRFPLGTNLPGIWRYPDLFVEAPWFGLAAQIMDLSRSTNGYFYVNDYRARGTDRAGLYVHDKDGNALWNSLAATRALLGDPEAKDFLAATGGGAVSDEYHYTAVLNQDTGVITVIPLIEGLPDLVQRSSFEAFHQTNSTACDLAFDAAGNLYAFTSTAQAVRVFSPGGTTTASTGSDGTFQVLRPPQLSVTSKGFAVEGETKAGFVVHRGGDTNVEVPFRFQLEGTATPGVDYQQTNTEFAAIIPAGITEWLIPFLPLPDGEAEGPETLVCTLQESSEYDLIYPKSATCRLLDQPQVRVLTVDSNAYERFPDDRIVFEVQRTGQTNSALEIRYDLTGGSATPEVDFGLAEGVPLPQVLRMAPGQSQLRFEVASRDDNEVEGVESVVLRLLTGDMYRLAEPTEATAWLWDDETRDWPAASVLFEDNFERPSGSNWVVRFGANDGVYDATVTWAYDYGLLGIPPAPNAKSETTSGLFLQLSTGDPVDGASSGINLYPKDRFLSGDFALQFDVFLNAGYVNPNEHLLAGLNHSGLYTNRVTRSPDPLETTRGGDGIWLALGNDIRDELLCTLYRLPAPGAFPQIITNRSAAFLGDVFPSPPYRQPGSPASRVPGVPVWTEVELGQMQNVVTLKLNHQTVVTFTNTTGFTNGTPMIGLNDQFDAVGSPGLDGSYAIIDNVRVISYAPVVRRLSFIGLDQVALDFLAPGAKTVRDVEVQVSPDLQPATWQDAAAVITPTADGFRATVPRSDRTRYFRVLRRLARDVI